MAGHQAPGENVKLFVLLAILKRINNYFSQFFAGKYIDPVDNSNG